MSFTWDAKKRRYADDAGQVVSSSKLRSWVDEMTLALGLYFTTRAQAVIADHKQIDSWKTGMRKDVADLHRSMTMIALGGYAQMTDDAWTHADEQVRDKLSYLDTFIAQVYTDQRPLDGTFSARSALYAADGFTTFENAVKHREQAAGMTLYRRMTTTGENCEDCTSYKAQGWRLIGQLPVIGNSICRSRCRCFYVFRTGTLADIKDT